FPELKLPLVQNNGGPIMKAVRIVPVLIKGLDPSEGDDIVKALDAWTKSSAWKAQLSEYGVGAGSVAPGIKYDGEGPTTEPGKLSEADQKAFVKAHAAEWDTPSEDSYYVVLFPPDPITVLDGRGTPECEIGGGGHPTVALDDGTLLKFSALQRCPFEQFD